MLKISPYLFFLLLICSSPLDKFIHKVPEDWTVKAKKNKLTFSLNEPLKIQYCSYSCIYHEPIVDHDYIITIDYTPRLNKKEIKRRTFLQDSISTDLKEKYDKKSTKMTYGKMVYFEFSKNTIDSLRLPFHSDKDYSYFIKDNYPRGHCCKDSLQEANIYQFYNVFVNQKY